MPDALKRMGVTSSTFYGNISCYWQQYAFPPYDLAGLTQAISDSIVTPRINAQMMIDGHPYLTRLNTFISPEEMTKDPFFFESRDLGNVSNVHTAILRTMCGAAEYMACNAPQRIELSDGRMFWVRAGSKATTCQATTPNVNGLANLPAAEVAFQREETGEGMRVLDNTAAIAAGIAANNASFPNEQTRFPIPTGTGGSTGVAGAGGGNQGSGGTGGAGSGTGGMGGAGGTTGNPVGGGPAASTRPTGAARSTAAAAAVRPAAPAPARARSSSRSPDCSADRSAPTSPRTPRLTVGCRRSRPSVTLRPWWKHGWRARTIPGG